MLQAEIAGRRIAPPQEAPAKGALIRDFQLSSAEGKQILLSGHRGQCNMVLILAEESKGAADFVSTVQRHQTELAENETGVSVVFAGSQQHASDLKDSIHLDFEVVADKNVRVHRLLGATDPAGHLCQGVFITDRFGEVFAAYRVAHDKVLPGFERSCPRLTSLTGNVRNVRHQDGRIDGLISKVRNEMKGDVA